MRAFHWMTNLLARALAAATLGVFIAAPSAADTLPYSQGLLWKVETPRRAPNYVFGTIHVSDRRVTDLPAPVRDALAAADNLSLELDFALPWSDYAIRKLELPARKRLSAILGDRLFAEVKKRIGDDLPRARDIERIKPWVILLAMSQNMARPDGTMAGGLPLDLVLRQAALARRIPVFGLETIEEQMDVFDRMAEADQVEMIRSSMATAPAQSKAQLERMIRFYLARDLDGIVAYAQALRAPGGASHMAEFDRRLLDDRNRVMARRMQDLLREGGAFVAVGAAHLPGEKGVIALLARRGYRIERVY